MFTRKRRLALLLGPLFALLVGSACSTTEPTSTTTLQGDEQIIQTTSYRIEIMIGPIEAAMGSDMSMTDQGQPVDHHLEIHIYDKGSGAAVIGASPTVKITDQGTGASREYTNVRECLPPNDHGAGHHYGNNHYLSEGPYTITLGVGTDTAVFQNIVVKAAGPSGM